MSALVKVLIVDDALFMRSMIKDILLNTGRFEIVGEAGDGREAVRKFQELRPQIVTMDIVMPELDGIEATREILRLDPQAIVIMCSALGQEALVVESISAGARDFIVKPFTPEKVIRVVDTLTDR
ncbi:MAG TPA: response regulator [Candidatus Polarisedimenticolia bacterium]|nr:response regulator [Candidatus Polarisedimenticolia bacterium]